MVRPTIDYQIKNSPAIQSVQPPKKATVGKKMWNPRWQPRNGCDGSLIAMSKDNSGECGAES